MERIEESDIDAEDGCEETNMQTLSVSYPAGYVPGAKMSIHMIQEARSRVGLSWWGWVLVVFSWIIMIFSFPFSFCISFKIAKEYERAVVFRLGRLVLGGAQGPGLFFVLPCTDTYRKVDLRVVSFDVPPQEILSKDSVTVSVDAVVYFRVMDATVSITNVEDAGRSTKLLAQTTLRNILGTKTLAEMLSEREGISNQMQNALDEATTPWGVKVERVEVKDVRLPVALQRAMATEAEAAREARAKVIAAEGEQLASKALQSAADTIKQSPGAIQLRYLQTLNAVSAERNRTIILPLPMDIIMSFIKHSKQDRENNNRPDIDWANVFNEAAAAQVPTPHDVKPEPSPENDTYYQQGLLSDLSPQSEAYHQYSEQQQQQHTAELASTSQQKQQGPKKYLQLDNEQIRELARQQLLQIQRQYHQGQHPSEEQSESQTTPLNV